MIVYLVGMPGSGKSTVGPELAGRLGIAFVELDGEIERATGTSVRDIFAEQGEPRFRELVSPYGDVRHAVPGARVDGVRETRALGGDLIEAESADPGGPERIGG